MKKFYAVFASLALLGFLAAPSYRSTARSISTAALPSPNLVISQFQAGGAATANDEFVELHNIGSTAVDLNGYRVVYRSASGTNDVGPFATWTTSTILQPGQYYLIASTSYTGGPTPNITYNPTTCLCSMSATAGGLAIRNGDMNTGTIIDAVGWGNATNIFFEGTRTTAPPNSSSKIRAQNGCQDSDNNSTDFSTNTPSAPRNAATTPIVCSGGGTTLFAALAANPTAVSPGANVHFTVTVIPATTPPSTGITVNGNLSDIGGQMTQPFFDDGTNGDTTAGDNVYSYLATIPAGSAGGVRNITAVAADAQGRTVNLAQPITINAPLPNDDPLIFGNPSNATFDTANENNYLMQKPPYSLSYSRAKATANWVAWRLDTSWIGMANDGNFDIDNSLPAGWYRVTPDDYNEPIYDRGHMCPSGDRTNTQPNNSATFLMTNIIPQLPANNQGPWVDFETYCRTMASQGNEIYIISGPYGNIGTIGSTPQNRVVIPSFTWKVVLILPNGTNDVARVTRATRAFGVIMSNQSINQGAPWRNFRVTVDAVEYLTGYDFFTAIPKITQELIERKRDRE